MYTKFIIVLYKNDFQAMISGSFGLFISTN